MTPNTSLIPFYKKIFKYMKAKAESYEGLHSADLSSYRKDQTRYANRRFSNSTEEDLLDSIDKSRAIYIGDFHTFNQNSKNLQRIVKTLEQSHDQVFLAMEFLFCEFQQIVDQFLADEITEVEFLAHIEYQESWRFPWVHYKPFFELAKRHGFPILALNTKKGLKERDLHAAQIISNVLTENPESKVFIFYGELHIVPNKIPQEVRSTYGKPLKHTIIHQNLDQVYWKQLSKDDISSVIQFNKQEFSLQTSPPWIKYESMIYWYENIIDDPDFNINEYVISTGHKIFNATVDENFFFLCEEIVKALDFSIGEDQLSNFELFDYYQLPQIEQTIKQTVPSTLSHFYQQLLIKGKNFKLFGKHHYYCSNYSLTRLSFLAGMHIHSLFLSQHIESVESKLHSTSQSNRFLYFFYQDFFAYLASKIINPHRKCALYKDLKFRIESENTSEQKKKIAQITLQIVDEPFKLKEHLSGLRIKSIYSIAKAAGYFAADLFYNVLTQDPDGAQKILKKLKTVPNSRKTFETIVKLSLHKQAGYKKTKKAVF